MYELIIVFLEICKDNFMQLLKILSPVGTE